MNVNDALILTLGALTVSSAITIVIGGVAIFVILLSRHLSSSECPGCCRRIPKDAFATGVPCPECGTELAKTHAVAKGRSDRVCRRCAARSHCVELWDGRHYCTTCVSKENPGLLEAVANEQLAEELPYSVGAIAWRMFVFASASIVVPVVFFALFVASNDGLRFALEMACYLLLLGLPVILLFTLMSAAALPLLRLKVVAWNGHLIVRRGMRLLIAPLAECSWREGRLSQITVWKCGFLLQGRALIIELPKEIAIGNRIAVGFTDHTRSVWQSFLTMAGVPRMPP